jgi:hypothetical protein
MSHLLGGFLLYNQVCFIFNYYLNAAFSNSYCRIKPM